MNSALLAALVVLSGVPAFAGTGSRGTEKSRNAEADGLYQKGLDRYAAGRFTEALAAFQESLTRDPDSRAARVAVSRVRSEMAMSAEERPSSAWPPEDRALPPPDETFRDLLVGVVDFEVTVGDARERLGRVQAMQGRIAQLLAERRIARVRRRRFAKDAELHALSRRLS